MQITKIKVITIEELQEQVYIITGVLAGAILVLFLFVIALIIRLERQVANGRIILTGADADSSAHKSSTPKNSNFLIVLAGSVKSVEPMKPAT